MVNVICMCASSAVPLKVAQTVENHFVMTVPTNVTVGMNAAVKIALQGILNVNTMGAKGYTVMTVVMVKNMISSTVLLARQRFALDAEF